MQGVCVMGVRAPQVLHQKLNPLFSASVVQPTCRRHSACASRTERGLKTLISSNILPHSLTSSIRDQRSCKIRSRRFRPKRQSLLANSATQMQAATLQADLYCPITYLSLFIQTTYLNMPLFSVSAYALCFPRDSWREAISSGYIVYLISLSPLPLPPKVWFTIALCNNLFSFLLISPQRKPCSWSQSNPSEPLLDVHQARSALKFSNLGCCNGPRPIQSPEVEKINFTFFDE